MYEYDGEQDSRQVQKLFQLTAQLYQIIVIFIAHLLEVCHAGFVNIVDHFAILIGLVGAVVVVIVDDQFILLVFVISNAAEEEVLGETKRSEHREDVEEQTKQSHRRGQGQGEGGGTGDENLGFGSSGGGREWGSRVSPFEG